MALADLAGRRVDIELIAPEDDFVLKPMVVREPFGGEAPERHGLASALEGVGARHLRDAVESVDTDAQTVNLRSGATRDYDVLIICVGGRPRPAFSAVETFWSESGKLRVDPLIERAAAHPSGTLAIVVPPQMTWPLPAYELALLLRRRAEALGRDVKLRLFTPEDHPLGIFGQPASAAVEARLAIRGVEIETYARVEEVEGVLRLVPGELLDVGAVIALPRIEGPDVPGLPNDGGGFIRVDEHCRALGLESVYAAGDATSFPVKQGGLAAQQADAAAAHIAASLGAPVKAEPFRPVLRGELLTGADSIKMQHSLGGGDSGSVSPDYLWWPRTKVSGRYLSAWLAGTVPRSDLEPREMPIEVEASWPHEWHGQPMLSP